MMRHQIITQQLEGILVKQLVPVLIGGLEIKVDPESISPGQWTPCHGNYKGQTVNSPSFCEIGDSVLVRAGEEGKEPSIVASFPRAEFGVAAATFLQNDGATVQGFQGSLQQQGQNFQGQGQQGSQGGHQGSRGQGSQRQQG